MFFEPGAERASPSRRFHSLPPNDRTRHARAQEAHEHARRLLLRRCRKEEYAIDDLALQLGGERPDDIDPADRKQLAELMDSDLGLAARDHRTDRFARLG